MAFITQTYVGDNTLQLGREEFVRRMGFGSQWRKIRIGLLFGVYGNLGVNTSYFAGGGVNLYVGVCQGADSGFTNPTPTDALAINPFTLNTTIGYNTSYWTSGNNPGRVVWKYGSSTTTSTAGSNTIYGNFPPYRTAWFFDLTLSPRNATTALVTPAAWITNVPPPDVTRTQFLTAMQSEYAPGLSTSDLMGSALLTYSGNFLLDSVCVSWTRSIPTLLISEISVTRFY